MVICSKVVSQKMTKYLLLLLLCCFGIGSAMQFPDPNRFEKREKAWEENKTAKESAEKTYLVTDFNDKAYDTNIYQYLNSGPTQHQYTQEIVDIINSLAKIWNTGLLDLQPLVNFAFFLVHLACFHNRWDNSWENHITIVEPAIELGYTLCAYLEKIRSSFFLTFNIQSPEIQKIITIVSFLFQSYLGEKEISDVSLNNVIALCNQKRLESVKNSTFYNENIKGSERLKWYEDLLNKITSNLAKNLEDEGKETQLSLQKTPLIAIISESIRRIGNPTMQFPNPNRFEKRKKAWEENKTAKETTKKMYLVAKTNNEFYDTIPYRSLIAWPSQHQYTQESVDIINSLATSWNENPQSKTVQAIVNFTLLLVHLASFHNWYDASRYISTTIVEPTIEVANTFCTYLKKRTLNPSSLFTLESSEIQDILTKCIVLLKNYCKNKNITTLSEEIISLMVETADSSSKASEDYKDLLLVLALQLAVAINAESKEQQQTLQNSPISLILTESIRKIVLQKAQNKTDLIKNFIDLVQELQKSDNTPVSPKTFHADLVSADIIEAPNSINPQQDPDECMKKFMEAVDPSDKTPSPFFFNQKTTLTCCDEKCKHSLGKADPMQGLQLPIKEGSKTLVELLNTYLSKEILTDYECDKCHKKSGVEKEFELPTLPKHLCIQLKRGVVNQKNSTPIAIDIAFTLYQKIDYILKSFIVHDGDSLNSGHYYAYVKDSSGTWYCYNDKNVEKKEETEIASILSTGQVNSTTQPYILFYEQKNNGSITKSGPNRGLENLGNTCFMNALLQCLTQNEDFVQWIKKTHAVNNDFNETFESKTEEKQDEKDEETDQQPSKDQPDESSDTKKRKRDDAEDQIKEQQDELNNQEPDIKKRNTASTEKKN